MTYHIDWEKLDDLLISGCMGTEIAGHFGISHQALYVKVKKEKKMSFHDYSASKKAKGDSILRDHQFCKAIGATDKGDNTLLIWLGKTRLGQREMDFAPSVAPNQSELNKDHIIMEQANRITELEANANKPKTE